MNDPITMNIQKMSESVYASKCLKSSVAIEGKLSQVTIDGCKRFSVSVGEVISSIDVVNCNNIKIYVSYLLLISFCRFSILYLISSLLYHIHLPFTHLVEWEGAESNG